MGNAYGIVMRLGDDGYDEVGKIAYGYSEEDVNSWSSEVLSEKISSAVQTQFQHVYNGELYFNDQDPNQNDFGYRIEAQNMGQLKNWAETDGKYIYYFNK